MSGRLPLNFDRGHNLRQPLIIMAGFAFISAGGLLVYLFGSQEPWVFAVCLFPATIMGSGIRTPGANPMPEQQEESWTSGEEFQVHRGEVA